METRSRVSITLVVLAVPVLTGLAVLVSGFGMAWDFLNYHYYDGYAVFHDRTQDIAPAGLHTYFNPTAEIPFYLGATLLPMKLFGFLFGFFSGLNVPLTYFLARKVLRGPLAPVLALLCALLAAGSANFAIELASVNHDNLVSLFFLLGLIALLQAPEAGRSWLPVAIAGALIGAGVGLKLTLAPFLAATGVCLPVLLRRQTAWRQVIWLEIAFAAAALAGVLATSGWWMVHLWNAYGNPLFPMFNAIFHSPYAPPRSFADHRFLPHGLLEQIAYPVFFSFDFRKAGINMPLHDWRYLAAYVGFVAGAIVLMVRRLRPAPVRDSAMPLMDDNVAIFFVSMSALAYGLWQVTFGVTRYLFPLDMFLPLVALAWLQLLGWASWRAIGAWATAFALLAVSASHPWHGEQRWNEALLKARVPPVADNGLVVMAGSAPMAFLIPDFPHVPFVRVSLQDGFGPAASGGITAIDSDFLLARQARTAIATHSGPLYVLFGHIRKKEAHESLIVSQTLVRLHLRRIDSTCVPVEPTLHYVDQTYELCALQRQPAD